MRTTAALVSHPPGRAQSSDRASDSPTSVLGCAALVLPLFSQSLNINLLVTRKFAVDWVACLSSLPVGLLIEGRDCFFCLVY